MELANSTSVSYKLSDIIISLPSNLSIDSVTFYTQREFNSTSLQDHDVCNIHDVARQTCEIMILLEANELGELRIGKCRDKIAP